MNHGETVQPVEHSQEHDNPVDHASILKDLEILRKERDLLEKEARRLALEVVQLQSSHRQLIATREFLLRQLDKQKRKQRRQKNLLLCRIGRAIGLLAKAKSYCSSTASKLCATDLRDEGRIEHAAPGQPSDGAGEFPGVSSEGPTHHTPVAVVVHAFYPELLPEILDAVHAAGFRFDLFVTCPEHVMPEIHSHLGRLSQAATVVRAVPNRGRDIAPFLSLIPELWAKGYSIILKLHTKRSIHLADGDSWRTSLLNTLLAPASALATVRLLRTSGDIGIVGPRGHILPLEPYSAANLAQVRKLAAGLGATAGLGADARFIAGSMFFARTEALLPLLRLSLDGTDFEPEVGQIDGTLAHAVERLFVVSAQIAGYRLDLVGAGEEDRPAARPVTAAPYRFGMANERA